MTIVLRVKAMRLTVMMVVLSLMLGACGQRGPQDPSGTPTPAVSPAATDRLTGLGALEVAVGAFPEANGVLRMTASFPRAGGTAEFWAVTLTSPSAVRLIEVQGTSVVGDRSLGDDPEADGAPVRLEVMSFDTPAAERKLAELPRVTEAGREVSLSPLAMDPTRDDVPEGALGAPAWEFLITERRDGSTVQAETIWISAANGDILAIR